jgi:hypothetical protein
MKDEQKEPQAGATEQAPRKLPYERPAVISDEVFETLALSCANARFVCPPSGVQS